MYKKDSKQALPVGVGGLYHGSNHLHVILSAFLRSELCPTEKGNLYLNTFLKIHVSLIVLRYYVTVLFVQWPPPIIYVAFF